MLLEVQQQVIWIHLLRTTNVSTKFHGYPSTYFDGRIAKLEKVDGKCP